MLIRYEKRQRAFIAYDLTRFDALFCDHTELAPCCDPIDCGHLSCPCGLYWDDGASGVFWEDEPDFEKLGGPWDFGPAEAA